MFTRNFDVVKSHVILNKSHAYVNYQGQPYYYTGESESWMPSNIFYLMRSMSTSYNSKGVILGNGSTPVTITDYRLSGSIVSGYTYSYIQSRGIDEKYGAYAKTKYTVTNHNEFPITISEIGLVNSQPACLIERQLLEIPLTIEGFGGVGQIEYTIYYNPISVSYETDIDTNDVYGVEWNYSSSSPALTRFGGAKTFTNPQPATSASEVGSSPFDSIMPWAGMTRYNIANNTVGPSETDIAFDMDSSDVVVYIPEFYYCVQDDPYNMRRRWAISSTPKEGFEKHPGSGRYIGRYHTSTVNGEYSSRSAQSPLTNKNIYADHNSSHAKGSNWWMMDVATWSAIQLLYLIEFANFDTWAMLGKGYAPDANRAATGTTNQCAYHTLYADTGGNQYRWIENPYCNISTWLDGWERYDDVHICLENDKMNALSSSEGYVSTGVRNENGGYMNRLWYVAKMPWLFIPYSVSGTTSTYVTEYSRLGGTSQSDTYGYRCVIGKSVGSIDEKNGFFSRGITSGAASSSIGSRLIYIP